MPRYANLDEVMASYSERFRPDKAEGVDASVQMNLTGDHARQVVLRVQNQEMSIEEGVTAENPTLSVTADADDWLAVENGQLNPMMAMMQGKVKLKGSMPFAMKFLALFGFAG